MSKKSVPSYCCHKASGQAYVKLDGKRHYLGKHGTPESRAKYNHTISEWLSAQETLPEELADVSVGKLAILYLEHARRRYRKAGKETSEVHIVQAALRFIVKNHRDLPASKFSPRSLKAVREEMIEAGLARTTINALVTRIRRMYRWAEGFGKAESGSRPPRR